MSELDPLSHREQDGVLLSDLAAGRVAELTLDTDLPRHIERELRRYAVPYGAVVALEPKSGRVLAYVSHSTANPDAGDLARDPTPPSASVFKVVTAAALVERGGLHGETEQCYHGGRSRVQVDELEDHPNKDKWCATLGIAMGRSLKRPSCGASRQVACKREAASHGHRQPSHRQECLCH
jgi:membrane peptidoglycan carboxypeptidase